MTVTSGREPDRPDRDRPVDVGREELLEVLERRLGDDVAAERVQPPERRDEQDDQRAEVGDEQPAERRGEQQGQLGPRTPVEAAASDAAATRGTAGARLPARRDRVRGSVVMRIGRLMRATPAPRREPGSVAGSGASALDLGPGLRPFGEVLADRASAVEALGARGVPVVDVLEVGLVGRVEQRRSDRARASRPRRSRPG